jgi:hypothetical protein
LTINLGLYDVFANTVPGLVYLFFTYELINLINPKLLQANPSPNTAIILGIIVVAFILGHLLNRISYHLWYRHFESYGRSRDIILHSLRKRNSKIELEFEPEDADILFGVIQHHDLRLAEKIEVSRVNGIMMRNLSFGFLLLAIISLIRIIRDGFSLELLISVLIVVLFSGLALQRAVDFFRWFYRDLYCESLNYGSNVQAVLKTSMDKTRGLESTKKRVSK